MLKQGSLKPSRRFWRRSWMFTAVTMALLSLVSGLRGVPPEQASEQASKSSAVPSNTPDLSPPASNGPSAAQIEAVRTRSLKIQEADKLFPPLTIRTRIKWTPKNLLTDDVSPSARYLHDLIAFALVEQFPERAEIHCPGIATLRWESPEREKGILELGALCNESHGMNHQVWARMVTNECLGSGLQTSPHTKMIAGQRAIGLVPRYRAAELSVNATDDGPKHWMVQEGDDFYYGTEEEIARNIESSKHPSTDVSLTDVPSEFQELYESAALAVVLADVQQELKRLHSHFEGSHKQATFELATPPLEGLQSLGLFVTAKHGAQCTLRLHYVSTQAAQEGATGLATWLMLGKAAIAEANVQEAEQESIKRCLQAVKLRAVGDEVHIQLADAETLSILCQMVLPEHLPGWTDILALVTAEKTPGEVSFECNHPFATTGFLAQSIQAQKHRGRRVRLSAEIGCIESAKDRSGVILCASDANGRELADSTSGSSIGHPVEIAKVAAYLRGQQPDEPLLWRTESVELDIPTGSDVLSLGIYTAASKIQIRNVKFEVLGQATGERPAHSLVNLPRNLLQIPGRHLRDEPINLSFAQLSEATEVHSANRESPSSRLK